jgi:hypothetical protein
MARIYGEIASSALMTFDKSFSRSNGQPLDSTEVFYSLQAAQDYAKTDVAYVAQKIAVVETVDEVTTITHYGIEADGSLKEIGSIPVGDGLTIEVIDGKIQLAALEGHKSGTYQPFLVDGKIEWREPSATTVEGLDGRLTTAEGDIDALEGIVGNAASEGVEASGLVKSVADNAAAIAKNAEDIASEASAREAADKTNADNITALGNKIGAVTEGKTVVEMIADAKTEATYDDTALAGRVATIESDYLKAEDKTELEGKIADAKAEAISEAVTTVLGEGTHEDFDTLKEVADWILSDTTGAAALITRVSTIEADYLKGADKTALENSIDALGDFVGDLPEGAASTTVVAYIQEVVDGLKIGDYAKAADLTALAGRVTAAEGKIAELEAVGAEKNIIASVDETELKVDADRKLSITGVAQNKITGLTNAAGNADTLANLLNSKVDKVEGSRLLTSKEAEKLEKLVMDESGNVGISGTISAENVIGLDDLLGAKVDAVEGMGLSANNLTNELLAKLNGISEGAQVNVIDAVSDEFTISADGKILSVKAIDNSKITGLADLLSGKVDVVEGSRLMTDAEGTKLAGIAEGAEVNLIDIIQVNGVALDITDKTVNIKATDVVKASDEIKVADDGTLSVGTISTDKLVQGNDTLILNGGSANA